MQGYGRDFSDQQFWARSEGYGYGDRDYGGRGQGGGYGYDYRPFPGRGYYGGQSHYWGGGLGGGRYDQGYRGYGGYGRDLSREQPGRRDGGFGYYGQGLDQGFENLYSGTHRGHGPIGRSSNEHALIYPPGHRGRGAQGMRNWNRQRYDRGW